MLDDRIVYLVYSLLFMLVWLVLFVVRRDLRRPMLIMSIAVAPLGPLSEIWYLQDYWKPVTLTGTAVGVEDVIGGFAIGGIAAALYPVVANKFLLKSNAHEVNMRVLLVFAASFVVCFVIGTGLLHINSIITSSIALLLTTAFILYQRPDLLKPAATSGLLMFVLFTLVYFVTRLMYPPLLQAWCTGCNPSGVVLFGVNLEELIWDVCWGACGGILYPAVAGYSFTPRALASYSIQPSGTI